MIKSSGWQFADVFETVAAAVPDRAAIVMANDDGTDRTVTWREFDRRANALAVDLVKVGLGRQSKVATYLPNRPEYLETYHGAQKIAAWPFNTNYRYGPDEILYLFDNADTEAVVFDTRFTDTVEAVRQRLDGVKRWYAVGPDRPEWAVDYEAIVGAGVDEPPSVGWARAADDMVLTYTGGTTGMPKGVMSPHGELFTAMGHGGNAVLGVSTKGAIAETASFTVGELAQVLSENGGFVEPGSGEVGLAAFGGPMPVGYYKDEKKSAETFRVVDGKRWAVPGDFATVEADGSMKLLGRGSVCINTGGEKVFVEEVEEVLKLHDQVRDAVCVGIPHERFGETVCAVVELRRGIDVADTDDIVAHVKAKLAGYKAPRDVVVVDTIGRAPSGKVDYKGLRALAREHLSR